MTLPAADRSPWFGVAETYVVASPALYQAPMTLTDTELLLQSLALPLLNTVMTQAREHHRLPSSWPSLLAGLRLWQLWDLDLPLSKWRQPIVDWFYRDLSRVEIGQKVMLPVRYPEFCAVHTLWLQSPLQIGIPLACTALDQQAGYFATLRGHSPVLRLTLLGAPTLGGYVEPAIQGINQYGQTVALATFIEYTVTAYGRERLPALVAALPHHKSWETLLPAIYGVSVPEFEAGWHAYLLTHYGQ